MAKTIDLLPTYEIWTMPYPIYNTIILLFTFALCNMHRPHAIAFPLEVMKLCQFHDKSAKVYITTTNRCQRLTSFYLSMS